mmetsp:Transcript_37967/g.65098  ORF Transcript_37967/g.65098 Transcript_37967/m.65098 type:complete len:219 (-) Transcript_37967:28-684(-)
MCSLPMSAVSSAVAAMPATSASVMRSTLAAGTPDHTSPDGTDAPAGSTDPAVRTEPSPTDAPFSTLHPAPMELPLPTVAAAMMLPGPMHTPLPTMLSVTMERSPTLDSSPSWASFSMLAYHTEEPLPRVTEPMRLALGATKAVAALTVGALPLILIAVVGMGNFSAAAASPMTPAPKASSDLPRVRTAVPSAYQNVAGPGGLLAAVSAARSTADSDIR